jgi:ammonium transporter Rh
MPGVLAGIVGAIMAGVASESQYGLSLYQQFPARAPVENSSQIHDNPQLSLLIPGDGRSAGDQAGYQLLALGITLVIAVAGGIITGMYLHSGIIRHTKTVVFNNNEENEMGNGCLHKIKFFGRLLLKMSIL